MRARDGGLARLVWADVPFYVFVMEFFKHLLFRNIVSHFYFKLEFSVNNSASFKVTAKFVLFYRVFVNGELVNQCANFCCHSSVSFFFLSDDYLLCTQQCSFIIVICLSWLQDPCCTSVSRLLANRSLTAVSLQLSLYKPKRYEVAKGEEHFKYSCVLTMVTESLFRFYAVHISG